MIPWPFLSLSVNLKTEVVTSLNDLDHLIIWIYQCQKKKKGEGTFERREERHKNLLSVV